MVSILKYTVTAFSPAGARYVYVTSNTVVRAKVAHHLPGMVVQPLVFSSLGGHTPATLRRLPSGGPKKGGPGVQSRVRQNAIQQLSLALLSSVISRFSKAHQENNPNLQQGDEAMPVQPAVPGPQPADIAAAESVIADVPRASPVGGGVGGVFIL